MQPFNYTPDVWVPLEDDEAIEERFTLVETADEDASGIIALLDEYREKG